MRYKMIPYRLVYIRYRERAEHANIIGVKNAKSGLYPYRYGGNPLNEVKIVDEILDLGRKSC